jgi:cytochrome c-type biogenesis protein CcmE
MTRRQKRMAAVAALVIGVGTATALGLVAFRKNVMYYMKPSELLAQNLPAGATIQLGGMVETGSLRRGDGLKIEFVATDCSARVPVRYEGVLPDLFREGQGVIATGHMDADHAFVASRILAKHDENYMPPDVAKSMNMASGHPTCPLKAAAIDGAATAQAAAIQ